MTTETKVVRLAKSQTEEASQVLARAFQNEPHLAYLIPDDSKRRRVLPWFFSHATQYGHLYGEVLTTADKVEGIAVWLPPDNAVISIIRLIRVGLLVWPLKVGLAAFRRSIRSQNHLEALHKRNVPQRHWHLMTLGVDPPSQGQGIGSALMRPVLARADAEGLPCYLDTSEPRAVPLYQRHGFETVVEGDIPKGGPHFWSMKREPRG